MKAFYPVTCGRAGWAFLTVLMISQAVFAQGQQLPADIFEGLWTGSPEIEGQEVPPIVFRIIKNLDGRFTGYLESPDRSFRISASRITGTAENLKLVADDIGGSFEGKLASDQQSVTGTWSQAGQSFPLVIRRTVDQPRPDRPQEPAKPYPYIVEEIVCENREEGIKLAGTLTLPSTRGPFPAVRLIGGSGALNRDDESSGHRTFLVLADYLTRQGMAVLRLDKRGSWKSGGEFENATTGDFARDVLASITYLKSRREIDPRRIGLIGHSEGAMIAPMLAANSTEISFIVMIAGPGRPLDEVMTAQKCLYAQIEGAENDKVEFLRTWYQDVYGAVKTEKNDAASEEKIRGIYARLANEQKEMLGWSEKKLQAEIKNLTSAWWRYLLNYDPSKYLLQVSCPVLALNGSKDLQVSSVANLNGINEALRVGGNRKFTIMEMAGLNHLLQTAETGAESEYAQIEETIAPSALRTIRDWIIAQVGQPIED